MQKLPHAFTEAVFGKMSGAIKSMVDHIYKRERSLFLRERGVQFRVAVLPSEIVELEPTFNDDTTKLMFYFSKELGSVIPDFRFDVPTLNFTKKGRINFWLYNIRFAVDFERFPIDVTSMLPFRRGYYGITKRDVLQRFAEHDREVRHGRGHILHKAWRGLADSDISHYPVLQIAGTAKTLDEIYAMEERAVAEVSLTPLGLNAIPGGYAGIRMLHKLSLLSRDRVMPDVRDDALSQLERGKIATHYRSGHMRHLPGGRLSWVSPCWVNMPKELSV